MGDKIRQIMLCPCCGEDLTLGADACLCGARFVGHPLDQAPVKVRQFGPVMNAATLMAVVITASLVFTKWLAFAAVIVLWSSWRAMRLARRDPENYGGYQAAATILILTAIAGSVVGGLGIAYIPQYLRNYEARQQAANRVITYQAVERLEEYRRVNGFYPPDPLFKKAMGDAMPLDYWGKPFAYKGSTEGVASNTMSRDGQLVITGAGGSTFENFELRSAGPDQKMGTADDIIVQDGIFITSDEAARRVAAPRVLVNWVSDPSMKPRGDG